MDERFLEDRFKEASVLPLWLHVGPASAHEPRLTEKACIRSWRKLQTCCQLRPSRLLPFKIAIDNTGVVAKALHDIKLTPTTHLVNKSARLLNSMSANPISPHCPH